MGDRPAGGSVTLERIVTEIERQSEVSGVLATLEKATRHFGADRFSYHFTPAFERQTSAETIVAADGFNADWISLYDNADFRRCDPIPDYVMKSGQMVSWEHALGEQALSDDMVDYAQALDAHGLLHGFGVPVYGPNNRNAYVAFGFDDGLKVGNEAMIASLAAVARAAHFRICALVRAELAGDAQTLSSREREVLTWVGRGKSNTDIATIIGVSPETVKTYLKRIYTKLDVADRVGATVKALKLQIIQL